VGGGVSIYITPLSLPHSSASEARGKFGQLLRKAGGAETGRITGAKEFKSRRAKRLGWRLREPLSLQMPICVFRLSRIYVSAILSFNDLCFDDLRFNDPFASTIHASTIYGATIYRLNDLPG
jgi:hypothetical protein